MKNSGLDFWKKTSMMNMKYLEANEKDGRARKGGILFTVYPSGNDSKKIEPGKKILFFSGLHELAQIRLFLKERPADGLKLVHKSNKPNDMSPAKTMFLKFATVTNNKTNAQSSLLNISLSLGPESVKTFLVESEVLTLDTLCDETLRREWTL